MNLNLGLNPLPPCLAASSCPMILTARSPLPATKKNMWMTAAAESVFCAASSFLSIYCNGMKWLK